MKVFIIHTHHKKSIEYANKALASFDGYSGWEPELFEGFTPSSLPAHEHIMTKEKSRASDYFKHDIKKYRIKKCCSLNHYSLFKKCVEINKNITIIEHDSHCIGNWEDFNFKGILVLNAKSAITQEALKPIWNINRKPILHGIHDIKFNGLNYRHDPSMRDAHIMPGTAAYSTTPDAANKIIERYEKNGWEQSDFMINTSYVKIQTLIPELFTFKLPNLYMSHGENIL